jgi:hypothetical protein
LSEFKDYYNQHRAHAALQGKTPIENSDFNIAASFKSYACARTLPGSVSDATSGVIINSPWTGSQLLVRRTFHKPGSRRCDSTH